VRGYQLRHLGLEIEANNSASLNFQFKNYLFDGSVCAGLGSSILFETFALTDEEFVAVFVNSFVLVMIIVFAALFVFGVATLAFVFASITLAEFEFVSVVVEDGESLTVSSTEILPVNAGIAKSKADSINVAAAIIVILDKIVCAPRG
jgi:uncharacterized protein involved in propanediol utilization